MAKKDRSALRVTVLAEGDNRAIFPPENLSIPFHVTV
jgi:hypothetical protein